MRIGNNLSDLNNPQEHGENESLSIFNELYVRYPITPSFQAYGFGKASQLNLGSSDKWTPVYLPEFSGIQVKQFQTSAQHSFVIYLNKVFYQPCFSF